MAHGRGMYAFETVGKVFARKTEIEAVVRVARISVQRRHFTTGGTIIL